MPCLKLLNLIDNINFKLNESYIVGNRTYIGRNKAMILFLKHQFSGSTHVYSRKIIVKLREDHQIAKAVLL